MYSVRPIRKTDLEDVREVCVVTAGGVDTPEKKAVLWDLFCDYYAIYATDTSFVVADENDRARGYLFCAKDYKSYEKAYREKMLPSLYKHNFFEGLQKSVSLILERRLAANYQAHLHIDIMPEGQRQGLGHKLMNCLMQKLHENGVKGVYLIVGKNNVKGRSFYEKYGFKFIRNFFDGCQYAIDVEAKYKDLFGEGKND